MEDETIIKLFRIGCGTALLIVHAVTGVDGLLMALGIFLLGAPMEMLKRGQRKAS